MSWSLFTWGSSGVPVPWPCLASLREWTNSPKVGCQVFKHCLFFFPQVLSCWVICSLSQKEPPLPWRVMHLIPSVKGRSSSWAVTVRAQLLYHTHLTQSVFPSWPLQPWLSVYCCCQKEISICLSRLLPENGPILNSLNKLWLWKYVRQRLFLFLPSSTKWFALVAIIELLVQGCLWFSSFLILHDLYDKATSVLLHFLLVSRFLIIIKS